MVAEVYTDIVDLCQKKVHQRYLAKLKSGTHSQAHKIYAYLALGNSNTQSIDGYVSFFP